METFSVMGLMPVGNARQNSGSELCSKPPMDPCESRTDSSLQM